MEKTLIQKIMSVVLGVLLFFSVSSILMYIYFSTYGQKYIPSATSSTYVTTMADPMTGEEVKPIEASYYQNKNGNGEEVVELRFNVYSDAYGQSIYSRGFQLVGDTLTQYNSFGGDSFVTGHDYKWGDKMFVKIDDEMYAIALDGEYEKTESKVDGWKIFRTVGFCGLNLIFENTSFVNEKEVTYKYSFKDLLIQVKDIIRSNSQGTGDSIISLVDLGNFLHVYEIVGDQVAAEPIGSGSLINSYFTMTCHYDVRGLTTAKQSLFGSISGDSQFNSSEIAGDKDYWKDVTIITLTNDNFSLRLDNDKNYASIDLNVVFNLGNYKNLELEIILDVSNIDGLDYYGLSGMKVSKMTLNSTVQKDFYLLNNALKDTGISISDISSTNINLVDMGV